jgi:hypothetical protein
MPTISARTLQIGILIAVLLASGCQASGVPSPVPGPSPTAARTPDPAPTRTLPSSSTETFPPDTPIPSPTGDGAPTATLDPLGLTVDAAPDSVSPDGRWIARVYSAFPTNGESSDYYSSLIVERTDGSQRWVVIDRWQPWGLGYSMPRPYRWSQDGGHFYWTNRVVPDGCGGLFANGNDLHRVDLADGGSEELVPDVGWSIALSPDETLLAYAAYDSRLVIRDIATGDERSVEIAAPGEGEFGSIAWAPDQSAVALTLASDYCGAPDGGTQGILRVDTATLGTVLLIEPNDQLFVTVDWPQIDRVLLRDRFDAFWWMDPVTGAVTPRE